MNGCSLFDRVCGVGFGFAFVAVACLLCFVPGFVFVALFADRLKIVRTIVSTVFEVNDMVYFGCLYSAFGVLELACVVVPIEGVGAGFLPLVGW